MSDLVFVGQFIASKAGKTGLTVTVDVDRYTISDGTRTALVTGGSATEGRRGLYHYRLASADLSLYQYVATFITADATVDQKDVAALGLVVPDALTSSRLAPATAGRTLEVAVTGEAAANVTYWKGDVPADLDATGNIAANVMSWLSQGVPAMVDANKIPASIEELSGLTELTGFPQYRRFLAKALETAPASLTAQEVADALKLAPTAGDPAAGSVNKNLDDILAIFSGITSLPKWLRGLFRKDTMDTTAKSEVNTGGGTYDEVTDSLEALGTYAAAAEPADIWSYTTRTLTQSSTSTTDSTTAGSISRRRGDSWSISLTLGAITGYTSLWFTVKGATSDADTASIFQIKKNASALSDGLLYVNGATASDSTKGSITVSNATTGAIVVALDESITDDMTPAEYVYDVQALISGSVSTPDSGTFTVTADVTRSIT